jgi:hypothetical protein
MSRTVAENLRRLDEAMEGIRAAMSDIRAARKRRPKVERVDPKAKKLPRGRASSATHKKSALLEFRAKNRAN